tara:strand:+ start:502 stop:1347 length:846 start_codon:yes stop_codon:yes gene_type:complete
MCSDIKLTGGISGCDVVLSEDGIVTKTTNSKSYEKRIKLQGKKQLLFSNFILKNISTPNVIEVGKNFIKMEYIKAKSFDDFLISANKKDVSFIADSLCDYISFLKDRSRFYNAGASKLIKDKIKSLRNKTKHKSIIDYLLKKVETMNAEEIPYSFCHGDLTFSNILFHENRLYFIDFLDTFINSYLLDLTKLKQDLYYNWSGKVNSTDNIRMTQSKRYIWKRIYEQYKDIIDSEWFIFFDILNILRIEPYLKNEHQRDVFEEILKGTTYYENFNTTNGGKV